MAESVVILTFTSFDGRPHVKLRKFKKKGGGINVGQSPVCRGGSVRFERGILFDPRLRQHSPFQMIFIAKALSIKRRKSICPSVIRPSSVVPLIRFLIVLEINITLTDRVITVLMTIKPKTVRDNEMGAEGNSWGRRLGRFGIDGVEGGGGGVR